VDAHRFLTRRSEARELRREAAESSYHRRHPDHLSNGEEQEYYRPEGGLSYIANYSKGLRHNRLGEVLNQQYLALLRALRSGDPDHFEQLLLGRPNTGLNLTNPQAGLAYDLEGADAQAVTIPPPPRIDEPENSGEMAELYWMALCRDVHFGDYDTPHPLVTAAASSLSEPGMGGEFSVFRGPKIGGRVTPATLFRGMTRGDLAGPYLSQFLLKGTSDSLIFPPPDKGVIRYGSLGIDQRQRTVLSGFDYLTVFDADWLAVQNGEDRRDEDAFDPQRRFIRNLRDLTAYVHIDQLFEAYLNACLFLLSMPARLDPGNPYADEFRYQGRTQDGFGTFGGPHVLTLMAEVATRALKAVWFQKWFVHRRLRPEEFGGRLHVHIAGLPAGTQPPVPPVPPGRYPMIDQEILASLQAGALAAYVPGAAGTYLLPQAFPEGCPTHPAYGAGHATVAGACVTVLKAWFDESDLFDPSLVGSPPNPALEENRRPKVPNANGTALVDYIAPGEPPLNVGGELNKLAANIALGRNAAGVHWRSDYTESVKLGEEIAIRLLQEQRLTYNENHSFSLTRFDGKAITI